MFCLLKSTDDWHTASDNSEMVGSAFIDLRKKFDIVDHFLPWGSLRGLGSKITELVVSYLVGRIVAIVAIF